MLTRLVLAVALAAWALHAPAVALAQDHGATKGAVDAKGNPAADHAVTGQGAANAAGVEHGAGHATGDAAHGGEHEAPPLIADPSKAETWYSALWVVIIFLVLLVILYFTAWKNVLAGLKSREERIRRDIADAEAARAKAESTLRDYNQQLATAEGTIRDMLAKAQADGERIATNLRMQAQTESEEIKNRANREIEAAKDQAVAEVHQQMAVLATSVAEKIIRRNLNPEDQRDLVNRSLEQLQTVSKN